MLTLRRGDGSVVPVGFEGHALPADVVWIDLLHAEATEIAFVTRATGRGVPTIDALQEIESSSRLRSEAGALYLSTPLVFRTGDGDPIATPAGFILTPELLVTVRFADLPSFKAAAEHLAAPGAAPAGSGAVFVCLIDAIIDRMADVLEFTGGDLDAISLRVFRHGVDTAANNKAPAREDADLREVLRRLGRDGDLASKIRDGLLGIGRILPYVLGMATGWVPPELKQRIETQRADIVSLNDYEMHLTNKVQLLLDATLGLINIEQNNIIKVLTIVSVVGVPPTLVASMYGMNFKGMPELDWAWGYPYALTLIVVSAVGPLLWFKKRGWL
ncbi:MAG TPA: magnesium transporter CorA family protein [Acetobacteraceae bacterium]|jgi:magnesium transporter